MIKRWKTSKFVIWCQSSHVKVFEQYLNYPDAMIEASDEVDILKDDATSTVCRFKLNDSIFVIKRTNALKTTGLKRWFTASRARKNFYNAIFLLDKGIDTFMPYAMIEERVYPYRCYIISSYIEGVSAYEFYIQNQPEVDKWQAHAPLLFKLLDKLESAQISHRDLNLSNIIWQKNKWVLIDLDGMKIHNRLTAKFGAIRDRLRFMRNWDEYKNVQPQVKTYFLQLYNQYYHEN